jgi:purine nucleosidase
MKRVKKFWSMGTSGFGTGNATPVAEFNVYHDAEAYKVLTESGVPITAVGLDVVTEEISFTGEDIAALEKKGGLSEFVGKSFKALIDFNKEGRGVEIADCPAGVAMACALWDGYIKKTEPCHAVVITDNNEAYGQVILYRKGFGYDSQITFDNYDFDVVTETESETFKDKLFALLDE